jgi:hypothetical protein
VPAGQQWVIDRVFVLGSALGTAPALARVTFYANAGTLPGGELFSQAATPVTPNNYSIPITGAPALTPGAYWLSVQAIGGVINTDMWFWRDSVSQAGNPAAWRNPGGGVGTSCIDWQVKSICFPGSKPDQAFTLGGTSSTYTPPPPPNSFTLGKPKLNKKKGTAMLPVSVPGAGNLTLTGKGVVKQRPASASLSRVVGAAGTIKLLVKPKGKTKRKLHRTGKVKVKVKITFTPTGGTPNSQFKKIKLRKLLP